MNLCLLDTDILSELLKVKNVTVTQRAEAYFRHFGRFTFSAVTWYEIVRGLRAAGGTTKLVGFEDFSVRSTVLPVSMSVLNTAADLWGAARGRRHPTFDADLLIAATALEYEAVLITGNVEHFAWMPELIVDDWRRAAM